MPSTLLTFGNGFFSPAGKRELDELSASHGPRQVERGLCGVTHLFIGTVAFPYVKISPEFSRLFFSPKKFCFPSQRAEPGTEPEDQLGREFLGGPVTLASDPRHPVHPSLTDHTHLAFLHTGQLHFFL